MGPPRINLSLQVVSKLPTELDHPIESVPLALHRLPYDFQTSDQPASNTPLCLIIAFFRSGDNAARSIQARPS